MWLKSFMLCISADKEIIKIYLYMKIITIYLIIRQVDLKKQFQTKTL